MSWKACILGLVGVVLAAALVQATALAAPRPDNRNVDVIPVECEGLGAFDVITNEHAATAFGPDGLVFVGLGFSGEGSFTVTTFDGTEFGPFLDSFDEAVPGKGFQSRLVECSFTEEFTETFILDAGAAEFFGIPASYVGTEVTLNGTFEGTAHVLVNGRP